MKMTAERVRIRRPPSSRLRSLAPARRRRSVSSSELIGVAVLVVAVVAGVLYVIRRRLLHGVAVVAEAVEELADAVEDAAEDLGEAARERAEADQ